MQLANVPGLGPQRLRQLSEGTYPGINKKITKLDDLTEADLAKLPTEASMAIKFLDGRKYTRAEAEEAANYVCSQFKSQKCELVGSYRRDLTLLSDIDILLLEPEHFALQLTSRVKIVRMGMLKARILYQLNSGRYVPIDIVSTTSESYPASLLHYTGSKEHNIKLSSSAMHKGMKLNEYGLWKGSKRVPVKSEADIFAALKMEYIEPRFRV